MPLTFIVSSGGVISVQYVDSVEYKKWTVEYSKNGGPWTVLTGGPTWDDTGEIPVESGDTVQLRSDNSGSGANDSVIPSNAFTYSTAVFEVCGNIMSLVNSTGFSAMTEYQLPGDAPQFSSNMFQRTNVTSAENLILPVTALSKSMYYGMFSFCEKLTIGPELPATTLADFCYSQMFYSCSTLSDIRCLATTFATYSTSAWVQNVPPAGTFTKHPNATWPSGTDGIPDNWTVVDADI